MTPTIGQKFSKSGITIYVQDVRDGWVFLLRAPEGEMERYWAHEPMSLNDFVTPHADNVRVPLSEWDAKIEGAIEKPSGK